MSDFESYVFMLCLIVFATFVIVFTTMIAWITVLKLKLIRIGMEDDSIEDEYLSKKDKKASLALMIIEKIIPLLLCIVLVVVFIFATGMSFNKNDVVGSVPVLKVVTSSSMATKYEGNEYLFKNNINNQLKTFDLILTHKLPKEEELKLYDIVVYEVNSELVIHRIVGIEEPNASHPDERHFLLQGDAVKYPDTFPVKYSQMKSIYLGDRIEFVGSFIMFLQSPAGMLCILLVVLTTLLTPLIEFAFNRAKKRRLKNLGYYI